MCANANITYEHCIKVLNLTVFLNTILHVWFSSKTFVRKLSTLVGSIFTIELSF